MTSLVVLGSGAAVPTPRRGPPGLLLGLPDKGNVLIDPGPGSLHRAAVAGLPVEEIGAVFLTHHHPDHTIDLMSLLFARHSVLLKPRLGKLILVGPEGTAALYEKMKGLYGQWVEAPEGELDIIEVGPGPLPRGAVIPGEAYRVEHTDNSLGYRFDCAGGTIALSGDAGPSPDLVELGREADLFLLECSVPDSHCGTTGHLSPSEAGEIAAAARPERLVLYHLYPPVERDKALASVKKLFPRRVAVAEDGDVLTL